MVDDRRQFRTAPRQVRRRQLAFEDRILQMVPVPTHRLKDLAQTFVIANVVADQIGKAHAQRTAFAGVGLRWLSSIIRLDQHTSEISRRMIMRSEEHTSEL